MANTSIIPPSLFVTPSRLLAGLLVEDSPVAERLLNPLARIMPELTTTRICPELPARTLLAAPFGPSAMCFLHTSQCFGSHDPNFSCVSGGGARGDSRMGSGFAADSPCRHYSCSFVTFLVQMFRAWTSDQDGIVHFPSGSGFLTLSVFV